MGLLLKSQKSVMLNNIFHFLSIYVGRTREK